jgi:hypothetical protein
MQGSRFLVLPHRKPFRGLETSQPLLSDRVDIENTWKGDVCCLAGRNLRFLKLVLVLFDSIGIAVREKGEIMPSLSSACVKVSKAGGLESISNLRGLDAVSTLVGLQDHLTANTRHP